MITKCIARINNSGLSVRSYFQRFKTPISQSQYFLCKRKLQAGGVSALRDGRAAGNHRKISVEAEKFLPMHTQKDPGVSLGDLRKLMLTKFKVIVTESTLSKCLKRLGAWRTPRCGMTVERKYTPLGGLELVTAMACHLGWPQSTAELLQGELRRHRRRRWEGWKRRPDRRGRDSRGHFTSQYNRLQDVRKTKFADVEHKRGRKYFASMSIAKTDAQVLARKSLAILTLSLLTRQGMIRSVDTAVGESLGSLCGFNYKNETLRKFFSELKYLGVAESLLRGQVPYWQRQWKRTSLVEMQLPLLCYYIDGNTKAYWSSRRVRQNKVTMLGRVMGCLEQVFVHDQFGRPLYFETYSGHAPLGEYVLSLMHKIEGSLDSPRHRLQVNRAIVIDGAGNSVRTLRAFAVQKKYHYITSLDNNQWSPRKIRREGRQQRYAYGPAALTECELELEDSAEPGYLIVVRAIKIDWDYGRRTVLITSLDKDIIGSSEVVRGYFERWPSQELGFKSMKRVGCLNRIAGYGKQLVADKNVLSKQQKLTSEIKSLKAQLAGPIEAIAQEESHLSTLIHKERRLRAKSQIRDGQRLLTTPEAQELKAMGKDIAYVERGIKRIHKEYPQMNRLREKEREWLRLQSKQTVYHADVELDQIATYFRVAFINLCSYLLTEYFHSTPLSLAYLVGHVLHIPATIEQTVTTKKVILHASEKDSATNKALEPVIEKINNLRVVNLTGQRLIFDLARNTTI